MTEAKRRDAWDRTANLMALIANCNRHPKAKSFRAETFHPFHQDPSERESERIPLEDWNVLRGAWGL
jgi:hypothetical protein